MKFNTAERIDDFCKKYKIGKSGPIRTSKKYPFIFLIYNSRSKYRNNVTINEDGIFTNVTYSVSESRYDNHGWYNRYDIDTNISNLRNHACLYGVYYSVFLIKNVNGKYRCLGEYEVTNVKYEGNGIISFNLEWLGENGLEEEMVYFVEKDNPIELSKLPDRSDVIEGVYDDDIDEDIVYNDVSADVYEGMYLDSKFSPINISRIIDVNELYIDNSFINLRFTMGEESTSAQRRVSQHLYLLNETNKEIQRRSNLNRNEYAEKTQEKLQEAYLYTVNVGCGLTNFYVKKFGGEVQAKVWAIDWGSGKYYSTEAKQHIASCIEEIRDTFFDGCNFYLEKLFISHGDSDHYNRIDTTMINDDTEVWVSGYNYAAGRFLNMLNKILKTGAKFKTAIISSSTEEIEVLHPLYPIIFGGQRVSGACFYYAKQKNNVSPIIKIHVNENSMVFPGDIMPYDRKSSGGWYWYFKNKKCKLECDLYIHSHHGSENGYITNIPVVGACEYDTVTSRIDILSTRDNAYPPNIPSAAIQERPEYSLTKITQLTSKELKYYKTNLLSMKIVSVF